MYSTYTLCSEFKISRLLCKTKKKKSVNQKQTCGTSSLQGTSDHWHYIHYACNALHFTGEMFKAITLCLGGRHSHTDKTHRGSDTSTENGEGRQKQKL